MSEAGVERDEGVVREEKESGERDGGEEILEEEEEEGMEASHKELARDMFEKITDYLNGELAGSRGMGLVSNQTLKEREGERERASERSGGRLLLYYVNSM